MPLVNLRSVMRLSLRAELGQAQNEQNNLKAEQAGIELGLNQAETVSLELDN